MDWLELAGRVAIVFGWIVGAVALVGMLVIGAMCWLLNHPGD